MFGLDEHIAQLGGGGAVLLVCVVAVLLGLRHATDPDHLTAVSTLIASDEEQGGRRAGLLGWSWGLGHATTLFAFGLPIVLFGADLPEAVQRAAELAIGIVIIALAVRLLVRWRQGRFHAHTHRHGALRHRHLHPHEHSHGHAGHEHRFERRLGRSPRQAYAIGLVHGVGGSAGLGVLLLAGIPDRALGIAALALFAFFTAVSMAAASVTFGFALSRGPIMARFTAVAPVLGVASLAFGVWYALGAVQLVPYTF